MIFGTLINQTMRHQKIVSFPTHLSSATALPWEITEHKKITNLATSNILFCDKQR